MKLELNEEQQIIILNALHINYMNTKLFFKDNNINEEDVGMITPRQYAGLHNVILQNAHDEGNLEILSLIRYN